MNTFTLLLTSSVLGAAISSIVSFIIQRDNYRKEYYKKILDKRLATFEKTRQFIGQLAGTVQTPDNKLCIIPLSYGWIPYSEFKMDLYKVIQESFWISNETNNLLSELSLFFLHNIEHHVNSRSPNIENELLNIGCNHTENIQKLRVKLEGQLAKDLETMHNIKVFIKNKPKINIPLPIKNRPESYKL